MEKEPRRNWTMRVIISVFILFFLALVLTLRYFLLTPVSYIDRPTFCATREGVFFETAGGFFKSTDGDLPSASRSIRVSSLDYAMNTRFVSESLNTREFWLWSSSERTTEDVENELIRDDSEEDSDEIDFSEFKQRFFGGYYIVSEDKISGEELSRRLMISSPEHGSISFVGVISERLILFAEGVDFPQWDDWDHHHYDLPLYPDLFWLVYEDGEWSKRPFECELTDYYLAGWEVVQKEGLLFLLLYSTKDNANYLVKLDYNSLSPINMVRLGEEFDNEFASFRVLTNEKHLFVFEAVRDGDNKKIQGCVYSTDDLAKVAEISAPIGRFFPWSRRIIVLSPNFRYLAYKGVDSSLYVYDADLKTTTRLRKRNSGFWKRYLYNLPEEIQARSNPQEFESGSNVFSIAFSADSQTLYDANLVGDLFIWNMKDKKLNYRVTGVR